MSPGEPGIHPAGIETSGSLGLTSLLQPETSCLLYASWLAETGCTCRVLGLGFRVFLAWPVLS